MLPHMRQIMTQEELLVGKRVEAIKAMAVPTRPHPRVPNDPLKRLAVDLVAGHFDLVLTWPVVAAPPEE